MIPKRSSVTLYNQGPMTLWTAVERVRAQKLHDLDATIFRDGEPTILDLTLIGRPLTSRIQR